MTTPSTDSQILQIIEKAGGRPLRNVDIGLALYEASGLIMTDSALNVRLSRLSRAGSIMRVGRGRYAAKGSPVIGREYLERWILHGFRETRPGMLGSDLYGFQYNYEKDTGLKAPKVIVKAAADKLVRDGKLLMDYDRSGKEMYYFIDQKDGAPDLFS